MKLGEVLKKRLKDKNITKVAKELNIPKSVLHEWVTSTRLPSLKSLDHLKKLANYLSLTLDELLSDTINEKIISSVTFDDQGRKYRIKIERVG